MIREWNDRALLNAVGNAVRTASKEGADLVAARARDLVPVVSGDLKASIQVQEIKGKRPGWMVSASGSADKYYASFVELGTVKMSPRPFLRPALAASKGRVYERFKDRL